MISSMNRNSILEYLVENLKLRNGNIKPKRKTLVNNITSNYILINDNDQRNKKIVFLIDKEYPNIRTHYGSISRLSTVKKELLNTEFNLLQNSNYNLTHNIAFIIYKDGHTFFRSAMSNENFRKKQSKSLKEYKENGKHFKTINNLTPFQRMIHLRPEELYVLNHNNPNIIQYYQPKSQRLDEMLVSFKFKKIEFDYSHNTQSKQENNFKLENEFSKQLRQWTQRYEDNGGLLLIDGFLEKI